MIVVLDPVYGRLTGMSVLQIAYPVRADNNELRFVLLASFNLQKFAEYHNDRLLRAMEILIVDKKGTVLVWPQEKDKARRTDVTIAGTDLFRFAAAKQVSASER